MVVTAPDRFAERRVAARHPGVHVGVRRQQVRTSSALPMRAARISGVSPVTVPHVDVGAEPDERRGHGRLAHVQEHGVAERVARIRVRALADDALERGDVAVLDRGPNGARLTSSDSRA